MKTRGVRDFSFPQNPHTVCGAHPTSNPLGSGRPSVGQSRGREVDHSRPSSADFKNQRRCTSATPLRLHGVDSKNCTFVKRKKWCYGEKCRFLTDWWLWHFKRPWLPLRLITHGRSTFLQLCGELIISHMYSCDTTMRACVCVCVCVSRLITPNNNNACFRSDLFSWNFT
jgi:hypothetical protein